MFLNAVLACDELALKLPQTSEDYERLANEFCERSGADNIYYGVIGALDGWLCNTLQPNVEDARNYFSGHYQRFGLNVQALCDAHLRFIYLSVCGPGGMNDVHAIDKCTELNRFIKAMPTKYFLLGDNAYGLSEEILIPFSGSQKKVAENDAYNYYLSQLRIRIEQAFGLLTTKWRIFRSNLNADLSMASDIINAASRLHNFVIEEDGDTGEEDLEIVPMANAPENLGYYPSSTQPTSVSGNSFRSVNIVQQIKERDLRRPIANIERNAMES
jgi:hypothetical protein